VLFAITTLATSVVLLVPFQLGVEGALLAAAAGPIVACIVLARERPVLRRRPGDARGSSQLPALLRVGVPMMAANALRILSRRVDGLVVFALRGAAEAGLYSVALTVSEIALYAPGALAIAAFPKLASLDEGHESGLLVAELHRVTVVVTSGFALALAAAAPVLIPAAFGGEFSGASIPAVLLLLGAPAISTQWFLARALAARARPRTLFWSGAATTVSMLLLDLALVPRFGAAGAAVASGIASAIGCTIALLAVRRHFPGVPLRMWVPGWSDVGRVLRMRSRFRLSRDR
jgi:O-antigen/teichoic acid export membrane protein